MYGKNIIDILIGAKSNQEFKAVSNKLSELGYHTKQDNNNIYKFFASKKEETTSGDIHIHLVIMNSDRYKQFLYFRDYLLDNKTEAKKYSDFKLKLLRSGIKNRKEYKKVKSEYVDELIKKIKINNDIF